MVNRRLRHSQPAGGLTLLELMVVVLIISILSSAAVPRYMTAVADYRVEAASQRIAADLKLARAHARRTTVSQTVDFDVAGNFYELVGFKDFDQPQNAYIVNLVDSLQSAKLVSVDFSGDDEVTFDMYGQPDHTGTIFVSCGSSQRQIHVGETGQIELP